MYLDRKYFEGWMQRLLDKLELIEQLHTQPPSKGVPLLPDGDRLLDNFDLCQMLNVSKRTLQRYRSLGELPYEMIYHKTFYKESDVLAFIEKNFDRFRNYKKKKTKD